MRQHDANGQRDQRFDCLIWQDAIINRHDKERRDEAEQIDDCRRQNCLTINTGIVAQRSEQPMASRREVF